MTLAPRSSETTASVLIDGIRTHWTGEGALSHSDVPFIDLSFQGRAIHRKYFDCRKVWLSQRLDIKTSDCPEHIGHRSQTVRYSVETMEPGAT